jgi:predicted DNA-binding transcriptional regulator AlpA
MSNITIYHPTLDQALELLIERTQTSMLRGREAAVEMCMNMAETQEYITQNYRKKHRHAIQKEVYEKLGVERNTFYKYAKAGVVYLAEPEKRQLTMEQLRPKPARHLTAVKSTKPALDAAREAELLKWEAFAHWLSAQMPADQFDKVYNRFCAQYRA